MEKRETLLSYDTEEVTKLAVESKTSQQNPLFSLKIFDMSH